MNRNEKRVIFENKTICREFFEAAKNRLGFGNWTKMGSAFGMQRTHFQNYIYGELSTPLKMYEKCASKFSAEERGYFQGHIEIRPGNWGTIKGGKIACGLHPEIFAEGRKIGARCPKKARECNGFAITNFDLNMPLSEELCEFVGAFIGDGYNGKCGSHYEFQLAGHAALDAEYHEYLSRNMKKIF
jgi:hypothetical protein